LGKVPVEKIPYIDHPEIKVSKNETTQMPFRYVKNEAGEPIMPEVGFRNALSV
jgi:ribosome biogenesis SPOUT family RNA methylase Rps3